MKKAKIWTPKRIADTAIDVNRVVRLWPDKFCALPRTLVVVVAAELEVALAVAEMVDPVDMAMVC